MNTSDAIGIAEGLIECNSEEKLNAAWQHLIDTGVCWQLQGWFSRTAKHLINEGVITNEQ